MKKLTIIYTSSSPNTIGNACRLEMIKYLAHHFATIIITNQPAYIRSFHLGNEVLSPDFFMIKKGSILKRIRYWRSLAVFVNSLKCDGVFLFDGDSPSVIWLKKPAFQYIHQYGQRTEYTGGAVKKVIKHVMAKFYIFLKIKGLISSKINFTVSESIIDIFNRKGVRNLELITHALDLKFYSEPFLSKEHEILKELKKAGYFIITYAGWCSENRGFSLLLDSIKIASKQDRKLLLLIAGADEFYTDRISRFKEQNDLNCNILNLGIIELALIPGVLYYSDVCLNFWVDLPGFRFSPPQKIVEYFAAGKPVLCNRIASHERLVSHSINGLILDYDANQLADACIYLKKNPLILAELSKNAINESKKYEIDTVYGKMVNSMKTVLNAT